MANSFTVSPWSKSKIETAYAELAPTYNRRLWVEQHLLGIRRLRRQLFAKATGDVLDVACGTGLNFPWLKQAASLTAVDLSPDMLTIAQKTAHQAGLTIALHTMDAEALTFADDQFDTVVSALSTCTFPDPIAALHEMSRVCKPTGQILLLEHGRSHFRPLARHQDRTAQEHCENGAGCRWNQEPLDIVRAAGLPIVAARRAVLGVFHLIQAKPTKGQ